MKIQVCVVYKFNFGEKTFVVLVVSEPVSPAAFVDGLSYYYRKIKFIFH
jgi:hypothetical protein